MLLASLLTLALAVADPEARPAPADVLTGVEQTARFEVRFRPGSRAEAAVDRVAVLVERELDRILAALAFQKFPDTIRLFLYDDVDELARITGQKVGGYATTLELHVPHDNDQTRFHELVHVVADRLPEQGPEPRNLFFAEGLANALLEHVHGVPVHAVAAFERSRGSLPSLAALQGEDDFYAWLRAHPHVNGYDIGGSFFRHLLDTHGPERTRRYYRGAPAEQALGKPLAEIERAWHARLDRVQLRPGLLALLRERAGEEASFTRYVGPEELLSDAILGPADKWAAPAPEGVTGRGPGSFTTGATIRGVAPRDSGDWSLLEFEDTFGDCMARVTAVPDGACWGVTLRVGDHCQAMLLGGGAFLYTAVGGIDFDGEVTLGEAPVDLVLRRVGRRASVWIDGTLVLEGDVEDQPGRIGIGVVQGNASFRDLRVRRL